MVNRLDSVVVGQPRPGAIVWLVEDAPDEHGILWLVIAQHKLGWGYTSEKRIHESKVTVVDVRETVYVWPHTIWDPEKAKAEQEAQLAGARAIQSEAYTI